MSIWRGGTLPLLQALAEAITLSLELQDVAAMGKAVQQGAGQAGGAKHLGPLGEGEIGGDDERSPQVLLADEGEQHLGAPLAEGDEAHLVQDNQVLLHQLALQLAEAMGFLDLYQGVDQAHRGVEADAMALLARGQAQGNGDVGFAGADAADEGDVLVTDYPTVLGRATEAQNN